MEQVNQEVKQEEPKLTRQQRRVMERINQRAQLTYVKFCEQYSAFFMEHDPDGEEVKEKEKEINAKWVMYCRSNQLTEESEIKVKEFFGRMHDEYNKTRAEQ